MENINQFKNIIKSLSDEVYEEADELYFLKHGTKFYIKKKDVEAYLRLKIEMKKNETSLLFPGCYEIIVDIQKKYFSYHPYLNMNKIQTDNNISVTIDKPSVMFALSYFDCEQLSGNQIFATKHGSVYKNTPSKKYFIHDFLNFNTMQMIVNNAQQQNINLEDLAQSASFEFTYRYGNPVVIRKTLDRDYGWQPFRLESKTVSLSKKYNSDLIKNYMLALTVGSSAFSYLSLYKIIEYFYSEIVSLLIGTTEQRDRYREIFLLNKVLTNFIDNNNLKKWFNKYHHSNGDYFISKYNIDSSSEENFITNIAKMIYNTRCSIVHFKEEYDSNYTPYSGQDEEINKKIVLLGYIAEELIVTKADAPPRKYPHLKLEFSNYNMDYYDRKIT